MGFRDFSDIGWPVLELEASILQSEASSARWQGEFPENFAERVTDG